ncbi:MAG: hypothetical protein FJ143_06930 [Deltaproteobacteria bacterium]|nr:hypothetical protein [Deltaproteobacteria bacterium]
MLRKRFIVTCLLSTALAIIFALASAPISLGANAPDPSACGIVSGDEAQKFVGGPLDVKESAKTPTNNGPDTYTSFCTYIAQGGDFNNAFGAARLLDLTLHFLHTSETMAQIYENSVNQYFEAIRAPDVPLKDPAISMLQGFGDKAFVLEAVTDPKTGYKSALIVFYKGKVGGSIAAWKKPEPALETTKTVLKHILSKLP